MKFSLNAREMEDTPNQSQIGVDMGSYSHCSILANPDNGIL